MKNTIAKSLLVLALGGLMSASALAQTAGAGPGKDDPDHPRVNEVNRREANQQDRIAQGIKSGSLSAGQAAHLEKNQQRIQNQEKADMAAHGGHLTKHEQKQLNHEQNVQSRKIYNDKHK
ncbi:MAG: hypothetical protein ACLP6G_12140 [Terriglobales bacterium]